MIRAVLLGASVLLAASCLRATDPLPNVVVIITDDQGYGDLSCHGNPHVRTPNLDRLHARSVRFTDFHVSPTCAPTRSALMTGRHEFYNGVTHTIFERERLSLKAVTLAEELKRAGYRTGIFGKWHLGDEDAYQPGKRGFDEVFIHGGGGIGQTYPGSCGDAPGNKYLNPVIRRNGVFEETKGYCTDVFFDAANAWMGAKPKAAPFFAYIATNAPHAPLIPPPGFQMPEKAAIPADAIKFYAMIENIDANVGRLLKFLADRDIEKETLVIFLTDNGSAHGAQLFPAGRRGAKGTPYEGGTRVPCFWSLPGRLPAGRDCAALTCNADFAPTLLDTLGVTPSPAFAAQVRGRSFKPLLLKPDETLPERPFITHVGRWNAGKASESKYANASIRNDRFSLVFPMKGPRELYDLKADPAQTKNVLPDHGAAAAALLKDYDAWWADVQPYLVNEKVEAPTRNPFHTAYWKQYDGAGPNGVPPKP